MSHPYATPASLFSPAAFRRVTIRIEMPQVMLGEGVKRSGGVLSRLTRSSRSQSPRSRSHSVRSCSDDAETNPGELGKDHCESPSKNLGKNLGGMTSRSAAVSTLPNLESCSESVRLELQV